MVDRHPEPAYRCVIDCGAGGVRQAAYGDQAIALHIELRNRNLFVGLLGNGNLREHLHGAGRTGRDDLDRFAQSRHKIEGGTVIFQDICFLHASSLYIGFTIAGICLVYRGAVIRCLPGQGVILWNVVHGGLHGGRFRG